MSKRFSRRSEKAMRALVVGAVCAALAPSSFAGANLIVNGAFEDQGTYMPVIISRANGTYAYWSDGQGFNASPWTLTGYAGLCIQTSAFLMNVNFDIGTYAMFLRAGQASTAEQTITISQTGCYRLSFDYWAWQGQNSSTMTVEIIHGDTTDFIASLAPNTASKDAPVFAAKFRQRRQRLRQRVVLPLRRREPREERQLRGGCHLRQQLHAHRRRRLLESALDRRRRGGRQQLDGTLRVQHGRLLQGHVLESRQVRPLHPQRE